MKWIKKLTIFLILVFCFWNVSELYAKQDVRFAIDYGRFRYDDTSVYLEVYYSVFPCDITFHESAEGVKAECSLNFTLLRADNDSVLAQDQIPIEFKKSSNDDSNLSLGQMGLLKLIIPEGKYQIQMSSPTDTVIQDVSVSPFIGEKIEMSDLELCSNIITSFTDKEHLFYKNTMKVIPNPLLIYSEKQPLLYYYLEIYGIKNIQTKPGDKIVMQAVIADSDGNVRLKKNYTRSQELESSVERGVFDVRKLESGLFTLIIAATDPANDISVYRRRIFYVNNPNVSVVGSDQQEIEILAEEFQILTEDQLDKMFEQAKYIATSSEKNIYKALNSEDSKRQFLIKFWAKRNKEKSSWKYEYYERVKIVNQQYSQGSVEGWNTDMGRVYLIYGPPDEYERNPSNPNENAYEIWYFLELEGGVEFNFVDINGYGIYQLVNSTKQGEVKYENWMSEYVYSR